jgi:four helix bundle protein
MIRDVTDLKVYKNALEALPLVYDLASQIPESHRKLRGQLIECGESIPAHIAEGFGKKRSEKEFKRFLEIAMGTSDELITHVQVAKILAIRISRINQKLCERLIELYKVESKQIQQLIKKWQTY